MKRPTVTHRLRALSTESMTLPRPATIFIFICMLHSSFEVCFFPDWSAQLVIEFYSKVCLHLGVKCWLPPQSVHGRAVKLKDTAVRWSQNYIILENCNSQPRLFDSHLYVCDARRYVTLRFMTHLLFQRISFIKTAVLVPIESLAAALRVRPRQERDTGHKKLSYIAWTLEPPLQS